MRIKIAVDRLLPIVALLLLLSTAQATTARDDSLSAVTEWRSAQKPLRVLLGYPAGGGGDAMLRVLAPAIAQELGTVVVIENKPGAAGLLALNALLQGKPDGNAVMLADTGVLIALLLQVPDRRSLPPFSPIAALGALPYVLVARPGLEVRDVPALIALLRNHPGRYTVATPGQSSIGHQAAERFQRAAGVHLLSVPYKGGAAVLADLAAGRVDLAFVSLSTALSAVSMGDAQLLATSGLTRLTELPGLPSLSETLPGFEAVTCVFLIGPAGMEPSLMRELEHALRASTEQTKVAAALALQGLTVAPAGSDALRIRLDQQWRLLQIQSNTKKDDMTSPGG
ncbi:tripartite tricarboxylate transporter substrate binding protein [Hydrogenophaga sp.]|uniref:tripartite tricarboxylate transporter substrate binding protein n=1 Tax=Hydrogenophaga sp. TaxID=1904254 RepID=UPI0025BA1AE3|nr:tripartite tricarboxylate transporter substrate binding protein [Hydrogenophaga sp.]